MVCSQEADRAVASLTANHFVVGTMPTQWSDARGFRRGPNTVVQCDLEVLRRAGVRLFQGADGVLLADTVPPEAIFRILGADNKHGAYTEVLAEIGTDRMLHLVRDFRAEAVEAAAAAMDDSAAAAGSADVPGPVAPGKGAGADEADTEESSSDSDLPDTTAPAAAKAEERGGAAEAAHVRSTAGSWSMQRSSFAARRSSSSSRMSRRVRPPLAPRPRGVRRLTKMRAPRGHRSVHGQS